MARQYSGTGQYLSRTDPTGIAVNAAWTFIANIWFDALAANQILLLVGTPGATRTRGFVLYLEDDNRINYLGADNINGTVTGAAAWHRLSVTHSASGGGTIVIGFDGTQIASSASGAIPELSTGDVITFGHDGSGDYHTDWDGRIAWSAWVQGTAISVANCDTYAQNPCNLLTDYGPSGVVTANALKGLWPFQSGSPGQDISGVGNDLTNTSTTDVADPSGYPTSCSSGTTLYFLDSEASGSNFGSIQFAGSAPSTATTATGWTVDTVAAGNYALMTYGSERASSNFGSTALPNAAPNNTTADCFRTTSTLSGDFATGVWTIAVPVIAVSAAAGQDGRVRVRLWRSTSATGASATEITSGAVTGTTVTNLTTGAEQVSTVTTSSITGFSMTAEYLFVQIAWEITGAAV